MICVDLIFKLSTLNNVPVHSDFERSVVLQRSIWKAFFFRRNGMVVEIVIKGISF